jgi:hypothetical protein
MLHAVSQTLHQLPPSFRKLWIKQLICSVLHFAYSGMTIEMSPQYTRFWRFYLLSTWYNNTVFTNWNKFHRKSSLLKQNIKGKWHKVYGFQHWLCVCGGGGGRGGEKKKKICFRSRTRDGKNSTCVPNTQNCGYCMFGNTKAKYSIMFTDGDSQ